MARELYFENILALLIAIEYKKTVETSFKYLDYLMEHGKMPKHKISTSITKEDLGDIHIYRSNGLTWKEIAEIYGYKYCSNISTKYKIFYG